MVTNNPVGIIDWDVGQKIWQRAEHEKEKKALRACRQAVAARRGGEGGQTKKICPVQKTWSEEQDDTS